MRADRIIHGLFEPGDFHFGIRRDIKIRSERYFDAHIRGNVNIFLRFNRRLRDYFVDAFFNFIVVIAFDRYLFGLLCFPTLL